MDRHRAPAMTRESICFGVYVDGVCAVGCDRPRLGRRLWTLLACSVLRLRLIHPGKFFTGLQLDHESWILSLEASRIWWLRHGLEFAANQKQLTGEQVAKRIGHITWSCLLPRPALSLINIVLHVLSDPEADGYGPWSPRSSDESRHCCSSSLATLPVLGHCGSMLQMPLVVHVWAVELRVAGVIQ